MVKKTAGVKGKGGKPLTKAGKVAAKLEDEAELGEEEMLPIPKKTAVKKMWVKTTYWDEQSITDFVFLFGRAPKAAAVTKKTPATPLKAKYVPCQWK